VVFLILAGCENCMIDCKCTIECFSEISLLVWQGRMEVALEEGWTNIKCLCSSLLTLLLHSWLVSCAAHCYSLYIDSFLNNSMLVDIFCSIILRLFIAFHVIAYQSLLLSVLLFFVVITCSIGSIIWCCGGLNWCWFNQSFCKNLLFCTNMVFGFWLLSFKSFVYLTVNHITLIIFHTGCL